MGLTRRRLARLVLMGFAFWQAAGPRGDEAASVHERTDRYEERTVQGWPVLVNKGFLADRAELAGETLELLSDQLYQVGRMLPNRALKRLRTVRIWVEEKEPHHPCMAYHPDPGWLRDHGMNPEKARGVEVANARNFLRWTREQPWMVLHELAHAYHHQFLKDGFDNAELIQAFQSARAAKRYESVLHWDGKVVAAYAATNPMEYFAESTEAYFGSNDFYPFVRAELIRHDPEMAERVGTLWGDRR
ncbi:MAG: metallopeptidase [Isosphaeraceae bacterium]